MKQSILLLLVTTVLALPASVLAASHEHGTMDHGAMHGGSAHQQMDEAMIMLPGQTVDGVTAAVHIKDVRAGMAKMGMPQTHHFMLALTDAAGKTVTEGTVALKIKSPDDKTGEAIKLMGMQGHFGADVTLAAKGTYVFTIGSQLADGKKRQFEFSHTFK